MRYEHLVQINDLARPDIPRLERNALWLGLVERAERPALFDPTVDATRELGRDGSRLEREVQRGAATICETVTLQDGESLAIAIGAGSAFAGSTRCIAIEEPAPRALFLRFTYELRGPPVPGDEREQHALRQAYYHADLGLVRRIRALAEGTIGAAAGDRPEAERAAQVSRGGGQ